MSSSRLFRRRFQREWAVLLAVLCAVGAYGAWSRFVEHHREEADQRTVLEVQARALDENLTRQLMAVSGSLHGVSEDFPSLDDPLAVSRLPVRLRALSTAIPGIRTLLVLNRKAVVIASNRPELIGREFASRPYFLQARADPNPERLSLSRPFVNSLGVYSMNLTIAVLDAKHEFNGVITATLDPEYFQGLMHSLNFAPDMRASVVHGEGDLLLHEPPNAKVVGMNLNQPDSFFRQHIDSGRQMSTLSGLSASTGDERLIVLRSVQPPAIKLDRPIVITVSRRVDAIFEPWWRQTRLGFILYLLLVGASIGALRLMQRRQSVVERLRGERQVVERRAAQRLELALLGADLALWDLEIKTGVSYVSERWNSMLGLPHEPKHSSPANWRALVHPEDWPRVSAAQERHLQGLSPRFDETYRMAHADGHWVWVLDRAQVLERHADGSPLRMVGTHMDVTEAMESRLALERSEQSLATTLNSIGDAVIATDAQGCVVRMNPTAERLTGWTLASALGRPLSRVFRILEAHSKLPAADPVQRVIQDGAIVELSNDTLLVSKEGIHYPVADSAAPIRDAEGQITGVVLVFSDVTERYRTQQALRESEGRLRSLLDNLRTGVIVHAGDTSVLSANAAACELLGLSLDQVLGRQAIDAVWSVLEDDGSPVAQENLPVNQVVTRQAAVQNRVLGRRRSEDELPRWALCNAFPEFDAKGGIEQIVVTLYDITERRSVEEELRLLATAVARLNDMVVILQASAPGTGALPTIRFVNEAFEQLTGWSKEEAIGHTPELLHSAGTDPAELARLSTAFLTGTAFHGELLYRSRQGREFWVEIDLVPVFDRLGRISHFAAVKRDITVRKQMEAERDALEQQLRAAQKMESIGTLAGGIAHDFNNILAAILGNVALAQGDLGARNPAQRSLEQIQRAGLRGRHLVQQILAFSRRDQPGLVSQALAPIMEECVGLLQAVLPAGVSLEALSPPEPVHVLADATQILQVLLNLCTNAWHALPPEGGRIELGLERLHPSEALRRAVPDLPEGECAHLWVKDNGSGMDEATRQRIFDPFFTTKAVGQGTGLGLSVVHGVVRSHSACMQLDSTLGQGSVFHLYFALEAEPKPPAASANALALPVLGEQAVRRVLYIDDDEVMALMVERILARAGFAVKAETNAASALAWLRAHPTGADVVVTDFNMPELSGFDVASQVEVICPGLPVVLSTGFLSDALRQKAAELGIQALVHKERSFEELGEVLQRMFRSA